MRILITGPQGSGKTTQANAVAEKLGLCFVKTGEILRQLAEVDDLRGRKIKQALLVGDMVDDKIVADVVKNNLAEPICQTGFVADGFPRTLAQLENFDPKYQKVFYLNISDTLAIERLLARGRADDTLPLIKQRLLTYHVLTEPLIDHYRRLGVLVDIDASRSLSEVTDQILQNLKI